MKEIQPRYKRLLPTLILLLAIVIIGMFMLRQCSSRFSSADRDYSASGADTLDIAIDYSPMSMYADGDSLGGFNYEMMSHIARRSGLNVKFHPIVSLDQALKGLNDGTFDILIADLPTTLELQQQYLLTEPVYNDRQVLIEHVDSISSASPVKSVLDLGRRHVWVVANSPMESRLRNLSAEIGDTIYVEHDPDYGAELLYLLTSIGQVKLAVVNERLAKSMQEDGPDSVAIRTNVSFTQFQAWAINSDSTELCARIDSLIRDFKQTDEYKALLRKY